MQYEYVTTTAPVSVNGTIGALRAPDDRPWRLRETKALVLASCAYTSQGTPSYQGGPTSGSENTTYTYALIATWELCKGIQ